MNKYAAIVRDHWMTSLPQRTRQMTTQQFEEFVELHSRDIEQQIQTLETALVGRLDPAMTYSERIAALATARTTAESDVLREMLPSPEPVREEIDPTYDPAAEHMPAAWDEIEASGRTFSSTEQEIQAVRDLAQQMARQAAQQQ